MWSLSVIVIPLEPQFECIVVLQALPVPLVTILITSTAPVLTGQAYLKGMTMCPLVPSSPPPPSCPRWRSDWEFPPRIPVLPDPKVQVPVEATRAWYSLRQAWKKVSHWSLAEQRCPPLAWRSQQSPVCRSPCGFWKWRIWSSNIPAAQTAWVQREGREGWEGESYINIASIIKLAQCLEKQAITICKFSLVWYKITKNQQVN